MKIKLEDRNYTLQELNGIAYNMWQKDEQIRDIEFECSRSVFNDIEKLIREYSKYYCSSVPELQINSFSLFNGIKSTFKVVDQ